VGPDREAALLNPILAFYFGSHPDSEGRRLAEILRQDDLWLEQTHDYIQWLFPLAEPSRVVPDTPILDSLTIKQFLSDQLLQDHLRASFHRMLAFLGLRFDGTSVGKAGNWSERKSEWFTEPTHNLLRITRMLKSLRLLGLQREAQAFYAGLTALIATEPDCAVPEITQSFWLEASTRC